MSPPLTTQIDDDSATLLCGTLEYLDAIAAAPAGECNVGISIRAQRRARAVRRCIGGRPVAGDRATFVRWRQEVDAGLHPQWSADMATALDQAARMAT